MVDTDWCWYWLILIVADWCWLTLIGSDWCWQIFGHPDSFQPVSGSNICLFAKPFWSLCKDFLDSNAAMLINPFCLWLVLTLVLVWSNMLPLNRGRVGSGRGMYVHYTSATREGIHLGFVIRPGLIFIQSPWLQFPSCDLITNSTIRANYAHAHARFVPIIRHVNDQ